MSGGTTEVHKDDDYLATGTHDRGTSTTLHASGADFLSCGVTADLYIENTDSSENSLIATVTETEITTDDSLSWSYGHTYKIYKTSSKGQVISTNWVDLSAGRKTPKNELIDGWRSEDLDLDREDPGSVFGPGQPSRSHR